MTPVEGAEQGIFCVTQKYRIGGTARYVSVSRKRPPALRLAATIRYTSAMPDSAILPPAAPPCDDCGRPLTPATYRHFHDLNEGTRVLCLRCWDARNSTSWRRLSLRLPTPLRADRPHEGDAAPPVPDRDTP